MLNCFSIAVLISESQAEELESEVKQQIGKATLPHNVRVGELQPGLSALAYFYC